MRSASRAKPSGGPAACTTSRRTSAPAFDTLFDSVADHGAVIVPDWAAFMRQFQAVPKFYSEEPKITSGEGGLGTEIEALRAGMASPDPGERRAAITDFLARQAMSTLGMSQPVQVGPPLA